MNKDQALGGVVHAAEQAITGINWPIIFYILFGLFVLYVLHNVLGISFSHFVRAIINEFRALLGLARMNNRAKLNALLIIGLLCVVAFHAFVEPIRHLMELIAAAGLRETDEQRFYVDAVGVFLLAVAGLLSVVATPP